MTAALLDLALGLLMLTAVVAGLLALATANPVRRHAALDAMLVATSAIALALGTRSGHDHAAPVAFALLALARLRPGPPAPTPPAEQRRPEPAGHPGGSP